MWTSRLVSANPPPPVCLVSAPIPPPVRLVSAKPPPPKHPVSAKAPPPVRLFSANPPPPPVRNVGANPPPRPPTRRAVSFKRWGQPPEYEPTGLWQAASGSPKRWVPKWVNKVHQVQKKKSPYFKNDPGPHGMPKQVFVARCRLVVAPFWPS